MGRTTEEEEDRGGQRTRLDRRALLQTAVAVPAAGAVAALAADPAAAAGGAAPGAAGAGGRHGYDAGSPRFALAVLPDTQYLFEPTAPTRNRCAPRSGT